MASPSPDFSASAMARSAARKVLSPSSTNSIAGRSSSVNSCAICATTHCPGIDSVPASKESSPRNSANSELLPVPLAPTRATLCPGKTVAPVCSSSTSVPRRRVMSVSWIMGREVYAERGRYNQTPSLFQRKGRGGIRMFPSPPGRGGRGEGGFFFKGRPGRGFQHLARIERNEIRERLKLHSQPDNELGRMSDNEAHRPV